jgi:uncharacterized membrane protein
MKNKTAVLWGIATLAIVTGLAELFRTTFLPNNPIRILAFLQYALPVLVLFLHAVWTLSLPRGIFLMVLAATVGFVAELSGLTYGNFFGGEYFYDAQQLGPTFLHIPIMIPVFWAAFIYMGYSITSSFLAWCQVDKPTVKKGSPITLFLLIMLDAFIVVGIDIFLDPLAVKRGAWTWVGGGPYYGIPIWNFIGWGIVTVITTGIFRMGEYLFPQKTARKVNEQTLLIPLIGQGMLYITLFFNALMEGLSELAMVGTAIMLPVILINLLMYLNRKKIP